MFTCDKSRWMGLVRVRGSLTRCMACLQMFGFVNLYEEIAEDDLEGPASDR